MKKIVLLVVLSLVCVSVFAAGNQEMPTVFDPTPTPFEGEWKGANIKEGYICTYIFTGNRFEYSLNNINDDDKNVKRLYEDYSYTGLFSYNNKEIQFFSEDKTSTHGYEFIGSCRFYFPLEKARNGSLLTVTGYYTKHPFGDLVIDYFMKEKKFTDIISNEDELASIQGTWRHTNPQAKGATYTFSGDRFTLTATDGRNPISGNIKIADNLLYLIVNDELFGFYYLDFLPENKIFLNELNGHPDSYWGPFNKQ